MGMSVGAGGKGGRRRRGVPRYGAMADINMTPFIDVMLVLLIIFMVAAPLLASGVQIDLPKTSASALNVDQKPLSVAIDEKGDIFVNDQATQTEGLAPQLTSMGEGRFRRADLRASRQDRELWPRGGDHVGDHLGRLQESRARDGGGQALRTGPL